MQKSPNAFVLLIVKSLHFLQSVSLRDSKQMFGWGGIVTFPLVSLKCSVSLYYELNLK